MKHRKSLIECEVRPVLSVGVYFIAVTLWMIFITHRNMESNYLQTLRYLNKRSMNMDTVGSSFIANFEIWAILAIVGIILLMYVQFKSIKGLEVNRFIKSLPYTNKEWFITKVSIGVSLLTVSHMILAVGLLLIRAKHQYWIEDRIAMSGHSYFMRIDNSEINLLMIVFYAYILTVFLYLLGIMMQYIINKHLLALLVAGAVIIVPVYNYHTIRKVLRTLGCNVLGRDAGLLRFWDYIIPSMQTVGLTSVTSNSRIYIIKQVDEKMLVVLVGAVICLLIAYGFATRSRVEDYHAVISNKIVRILFCVGVVWCASLLVGVITMEILWRNPMVGLVLGFAVGLVATTFVLYKVVFEERSRG